MIYWEMVSNILNFVSSDTKDVYPLRLDMVVVCGKKMVAIECDGERYHNGEAKIREDMERQTILERLGWRFIRIRGSEYFRDPDKTIERVVSELSVYGILPEADNQNFEPVTENSELLARVKARAAYIISASKKDKSLDIETVVAALSTSGTIETTASNIDDAHAHVVNEERAIQITLFDILQKRKKLKPLK